MELHRHDCGYVQDDAAAALRLALKVWSQCMLLACLTLCQRPHEVIRGSVAFVCVAQAMRRDIMKQLEETRPQRSATQPGKTWVRGWDDWQKEQPQQAAQGN